MFIFYKAGVGGVDFYVENITNAPGLVTLADMLKDKFGNDYFIMERDFGSRDRNRRP